MEESASAAPASRPVIGGRYLLREKIGSGGMASIWRAEHLMLKRPVALKFLELPPGRDASEVRDRFLREARVAASVQHRNVVQIMDFGATPDGRPYMVMELLEGRSLATRINEGPLDLPEVVRIVARLLAGLSAVHAAGIVHRDLKPENVFLVREDDLEYPKLLDFGISKVVRDGGDRGVRSVIDTSELVIAGTPTYMSPEQARGRQDLDPRTDVYSVGVMTYELLVGFPPFEGDNPQDLLVTIASTDAMPLASLRPDLPAALCAVVDRALSRERDDRFASAADMRRALLAAASAVLASSPAGPSSSSQRLVDSVAPPFDRDAMRSALDEAYEPGDSGVVHLDELREQGTIEASAAPIELASIRSGPAAPVATAIAVDRARSPERARAPARPTDRPARARVLVAGLVGAALVGAVIAGAWMWGAGGSAMQATPLDAQAADARGREPGTGAAAAPAAARLAPDSEGGDPAGARAGASHGAEGNDRAIDRGAIGADEIEADAPGPDALVEPAPARPRPRRRGAGLIRDPGF